MNFALLTGVQEVWSRFRDIKKRDWRIRAIWRSSLILLALTIVLYVAAITFSIGMNPETHWGAVFAAWVGGLALFLLGGFLVAVVSLVRPEEETFSNRARILFQGQSGPHIDYISRRIHELEHYAVLTEKRIAITDYHPASHKFRLEIETVSKVKSYISDIQSTYNSRVKLTDVTPSPIDSAPNRLTFVKINGVPQGSPEDFSNSAVERNFDVVIPRGEECEIATRIDEWIIGTSEKNTFTPIRFTRSVVVDIENRLSNNRSVKVQLVDDNEELVSEITLAAGHGKRLISKSDIEPGRRVYDFRVIDLDGAA